MSCRERDREECRGEARPVVYIFKTPGDAVLTSNDCDGEDIDEEKRKVRQSSDI